MYPLRYFAIICPAISLSRSFAALGYIENKNDQFGKRATEFPFLGLHKTASRNTMGHQIPPDTILIMGAGVAGLVLAQGLRLRSIPFRLFERHPQSHQAQGHRFRISSEAQVALERVLPYLQRILKKLHR